ncbi:efflux RND transporter permease subunit [Massilia horti]|uniref:Efflux RND transporter permease subunit n=1 Tax=Massilia horti TaxID=2562153 RepID=A0A4Y9SY04_9BURK|nr:efflux RND transporter permease subunit [Massilia horti]TFW31593.1 efflux RND transporter permease subunit [Massilia horti]TFW31614.1 efflux RND transporter permease subunit [Massilia horti]
MWIVRVALRRPYTFIVLALLIVLAGTFAILRTATDIFPEIRIPIVNVIWTYTGLPPEDMANRIVSFSERGAQTVVNDVERTESQNLSGTALVKYYFRPNVNLDLALSQITGISQTQLRFTPPGTNPPIIITYNASSVPILQLALTSGELSEAQMFDLGNTFIRTALSTVQGASLPFPYGGRQRQVQVDLDPPALRARNLSAQDVVAAINAQNLIVPAGTQKIGDFEYNIKLNSSPLQIEELNNLPVRSSGNAITFVRDVAHVHDGSAPQTNMVRVNGQRAVLMSVVKTGTASTLDVVDSIHRLLPGIRASMPPALNITTTGDQSLFVRAAVSSLVREATIAAALTGLMILLLLASWRSALIITISIPLSVLVSLICLSALGETINLMTLGGLALAVGVLVDDATVAIENINWNLEQGKEVEQAILDGAQQIAVPALVATLAICIVFVPMFFLKGVPRFLFVPMAEAVIFAMLASYGLSRTLVPTLAKYWLRAHKPQEQAAPRGNVFARAQERIGHGFESLRDRYQNTLGLVLAWRRGFVLAFLGFVALSFLLLPWLGRDFFPSVDAGQIKLHLRAPTGTRIEETAALCDRVERVIRQVIPANELANMVDNIGLPNSAINLASSNSAPVGPGDADVLISLSADHHSTHDYERLLRRKLNESFPSVTFAFLPADIVTQILNFGLPSPIDVQVVGFDQEANRAFANRLYQQLRKIPGLADLRIQQALDYPELDVEVNRSKAAEVGLTQRDVATDLLVSLSGSFQTSPSFWADPKTGVQYNVAVQAPQYRLTTLQDLRSTPITSLDPGSGTSQLLANLSTVSRGVGPAVISHYNVKPTIDLFARVEDSDLGSVANAVQQVVDQSRKGLPRGSELVVRGQVETMNASFTGLQLGLAAAVVLIYLLIVVNFQSWLDPLIIITVLPAALAGIVWMLFATGTPISVPALTGAIMCMGVATANSILLVSFARERMEHGIDPVTAAHSAGYTRFRPVLMTALAMIIGMFPLALGLGEGGEQNAPLGRAVIGGLLFATVSTLLFVPAVFAIIHGWRAKRRGGAGDARG